LKILNSGKTAVSGSLLSSDTDQPQVPRIEAVFARPSAAFQSSKVTSPSDCSGT
jgi:hypothetical protein